MFFFVVLVSRSDTSALLVHLAGVDLTSEGRTWLLENLSPNQIVWFKLISREDHVLHCLVSQNKVRDLKNTKILFYFIFFL